MPFVAIPDCAKIEVVAHHSMTLLPIVNVFHCTTTGSPPDAQIDGVANATGAYWAAHAADVLAHEWVGDFVRVTDMSVITGHQKTDVQISGVTGGVSIGDAPNSCALVKMTTHLRSRRGRGRAFMSPIIGDQVDANGALTPVYRTHWDTFMNGFNTALSTFDVATVLAIASKLIPAATAVSTISTEPQIASQRRRIGR
jgi:hypothetical protein